LHEPTYVIEVDGLKKHFPLRDGLFGQQTGSFARWTASALTFAGHHFWPGGRIRQR
jgi:hypothetical protein